LKENLVFDAECWDIFFLSTPLQIEFSYFKTKLGASGIWKKTAGQLSGF